MVTETEHCYIVKNERILKGEPIVKDTRTPVRAIVELWRMGIAPEEIPTRLPHLTLSAVFDALSLARPLQAQGDRGYYADHQEEVNGHILRNRNRLTTSKNR